MDTFFSILIVFLLFSFAAILFFAAYTNLNSKRKRVLPQNAPILARLLNEIASKDASFNVKRQKGIDYLLKKDKENSYIAMNNVLLLLPVRELIEDIPKSLTDEIRVHFYKFCDEFGFIYSLQFLIDELPNTDARHINRNKQVLEKNIRSDTQSANLSFAKVVEGLRLLNEDTGEKYAELLEKMREGYRQFREANGFEYPAEYLPKKPRKSNFN